jgi:hypothetical protein
VNPDEAQALRLHEAAHAAVACRLGIPIQKILVDGQDHGVLAYALDEDAKRKGVWTGNAHMPPADRARVSLRGDNRLTFFLGGYAIEEDIEVAALRSADDFASFFGLIDALCGALPFDERTSLAGEAFQQHLLRARGIVAGYRTEIGRLATALAEKPLFEDRDLEKVLRDSGF